MSLQDRQRPDAVRLSAQWEGPYTVLKQMSPVSYLIQMPNKRKKERQLHINMLREWRTPSQVFNVMCVQEEEETEELGLCTIDCKGEEGEAITNPNLTVTQQRDLKKLLKDSAKILNNKPGLTNLAEHKIQTGEATPIRQHPYRIPAAWREEVRKEIDLMLQLGVIEPSDFPWASPIVTVRKKDGSLRLCVDYRKLNSMTQEDQYQMPRVEELIERLGKAECITTLDLTKVYYQVPVCKKDQEKTAFLTPMGKYQFRTMPFGLKNAPSTFQRLIDRVLKDCYQFSSAYIDDIVIFSTMELGRPPGTCEESPR